MKTFIKKLFYPTTIVGKLILLVYFLSLTGLMIYGAINKSISSLVVLPFFIFALVKVILNFKNKDTKISSESIKKNFKIFLNGLKATIFVFAKNLPFLSVIIVVYLLYYLITDNAAYNKSANNNAFVSVYSKTYDYEDRAELFESLCYNDDFTKKSLENEKIAKKTKMLIEYIKEYYPSCKEGSFWEDTYNKFTENNN